MLTYYFEEYMLILLSKFFMIAAALSLLKFNVLFYLWIHILFYFNSLFCSRIIEQTLLLGIPKFTVIAFGSSLFNLVSEKALLRPIASFMFRDRSLFKIVLLHPFCVKCPDHFCWRTLYDISKYIDFVILFTFKSSSYFCNFMLHDFIMSSLLLLVSYIFS